MSTYGNTALVKSLLKTNQEQIDTLQLQIDSLLRERGKLKELAARSQEKWDATYAKLLEEVGNIPIE